MINAHILEITKSLLGEFRTKRSKTLRHVTYANRSTYTTEKIIAVQRYDKSVLLLLGVAFWLGKTNEVGNFAGLRISRLNPKKSRTVSNS